MTPRDRAMRDLLDAVKRMGWDVSLHDEDGLVAGEAGFISEVMGALCTDRMRPTGQLVEEDRTDGAPEPWVGFGAAESVENRGEVSGETDPAQDAPSGPTEAVEDRPKGADSPRLDTPVQADSEDAVTDAEYADAEGGATRLDAPEEG